MAKTSCLEVVGDFCVCYFLIWKCYELVVSSSSSDRCRGSCDLLFQLLVNLENAVVVFEHFFLFYPFLLELEKVFKLDVFDVLLVHRVDEFFKLIISLKISVSSIHSHSRTLRHSLTCLIGPWMVLKRILNT